MHSDLKKANVQRRDHANFAPNSREKIANFPKIFGALRAQKMRHSASVVAQTAEFCCSSFPSRCAFECKIKRESSVEITQSLRKNRAKNLQNFRKFGAPRAQKLRAFSHRALRMLQNVIESWPSQHCIQIRKSKRPASESHKFCAELARKNCKVSENFRRAARRKVA